MKRIPFIIAVGTLAVTALVCSFLIACQSQPEPKPETVPAAFQQGADVEETLAQIEEKSKAIKSSPRNDVLYYERGRLYGRLGKLEEALNDFNNAIMLSPENVEYYYYRSGTLGNLNRFREALDAINMALKYDPENHEYLFIRGQFHASLGEFLAAENDFTKVINSGINLPGLFYTRGLVYGHMEKWDEAINDFTKEIELYPNNGMAILARGESYTMQGKYNEALTDINSIWAIADPEEFFYIYTRRARIYMFMEKWQEVVQDLNSAIKLNSREPELYSNRAQIYAKLAETTTDSKEKAEYQRLEREDNATAERLKAATK